MDECVQCRGCEAACPSAVQFGHLMEDTRAALHDRHAASRGRDGQSSGSRTALVLPRALAAARAHVAARSCAQRLHLVPRRFGLPALPAAQLCAPLDVADGGEPDAWCSPAA